MYRKAFVVVSFRSLVSKTVFLRLCMFSHAMFIGERQPIGAARVQTYPYTESELNSLRTDGEHQLQAQTAMLNDGKAVSQIACMHKFIPSITIVR